MNGSSIRTPIRASYVQRGDNPTPDPGSEACACKVPQMSADLNACNVLYSDPSTFVVNTAKNMCDAMQCAAGIGRGLFKIPFQVTLNPGANLGVTVQFARDAFVWGIVFYQGAPNFDRQQWTISALQSSAQTQAWDVYAQGSTFGVGGAQPFNPNTAALPLELFFEQGDDDLSNLIHGRNFLPPLVANSNVGDGNNSINYTLALAAAAVAPQVATGWHYVYFPGKKGV